MLLLDIQVQSQLAESLPFRRETVGTGSSEGTEESSFCAPRFIPHYTVSRHKKTFLPRLTMLRSTLHTALARACDFPSAVFVLFLVFFVTHLRAVRIPLQLAMRLTRLPPAAADPRRIKGKVTRTGPETRPQTQGPLIRFSTTTNKD